VHRPVELVNYHQAAAVATSINNLRNEVFETVTI
jgi:hypothetical protein